MDIELCEASKRQLRDALGEMFADLLRQAEDDRDELLERISEVEFRVSQFERYRLRQYAERLRHEAARILAASESEGGEL